MHTWPLSKPISLNLHTATVYIPIHRHKLKNQVKFQILGELGKMCHHPVTIPIEIKTTMTMHMLGVPCRLVLLGIETIRQQGNNMKHGAQIIVQLEILGMFLVGVTQSPE